MIVLPIVTRELLVQSRRKGTYRTRMVAASVAGLIMLWMLIVSGAPIPMASQGRALFIALSVTAFIYCSLVGALLTADCLSVEKRDGTLGLLFLTDLRGHDVVCGKLVSSSIHTAYGLLGIVPVLSLATLFGGVTAIEITRMLLVLANTMFLSLAIGMFVSTVSQNDRKAVFATVVLLLLIMFGPFGLGFAATNAFASGNIVDAEPFFTPSPLFAFDIVRSPMPGLARLERLYQSLGWAHAFAWIFLVFSSITVPYAWKDRAPGKRAERWNARWRRWSLGPVKKCLAFRRRSLDRNAFFWLCARERRRRLLAWILIVPLTAIGAWIFTFWPLGFYESSLVLLAILHVMLKVWLAGEVCNRWIEDRRNGALELILCTPVQTRHLLRGQELALWRQFGWPVVAVVLLAGAVWMGIAQSSGLGTSSESGRRWLIVGVPALVADLLALRWVGMWVALRARGLNRAIAISLGQVLGLRWLIYFVVRGASYAWSWIGFRPLPFLSTPAFWLMLALALDLALAISARRKFLKYFRAIASSPSDYQTAIAAEDSASLPEATPETRARVRNRGRWQLDRSLKWALVILAALTLIFGGQAVYRLWMKSRVENRLAALRQAGEAITIEEMDQRRPSLPPNQNAALVMERVFAELTNWHSLTPELRRKLPDWLASATKNPLTPGEPLPSAVKEAIVTALSSNRTILKIVEDAGSLRKARFAMDWRLGPESLYGRQSQSFWVTEELLALDVVARGDDGDLAGALKSLHRLFDLAHSLDGEPAMFYTMRVAAFQKGIVAMEWLLSRFSLSETQLTHLVRQLNDAEQKADLRNAILGWRCMAIESYRSPPVMPKAASAFGPTTPSPFRAFQWQLQQRIRNWTAAGEHDLLHLLDWTDGFLRIAELPFPDRLERAQAIQPEPAHRSRFFGVQIDPKLLFDQLVMPNAKFAARCRTALIGLAVERYRLHHDGRAPEDLEELAPSFLSQIGVDPFDGRQLRFKRLSPRGHMTYSVGHDRQDDTSTAPPEGKDAARASGHDILFRVAR